MANPSAMLENGSESSVMLLAAELSHSWSFVVYVSTFHSSDTPFSDRFALPKVARAEH